jgi:hypothetical protein
MLSQSDGPDGNQARFFERIRVVEVESRREEVTVVDPGGTSRTWKKGDRIIEENAVLNKVTRSLLVFTRNVEGTHREGGNIIVVVRFDLSGRTKVREYSSQPDSPLSTAPLHDSHL